MSFAGVVLACWIAMAAIAFMGLSALTRLAARQDGEAELGIVGETELRMLLGNHDEERLPLETRLAYLGVQSARHPGSI